MAWLCKLLHCVTPILLLLIAVAEAQSQPVVKTVLGNVIGSYCAGTNNTVARFIGIPYAQPPVKSLRWTAPKTYDKRYPNAGYNATTPKPYCHQLCGDMNFHKAVNQSEDCLYLNVWAPARAQPFSGLPVRVYIHGGAFTTGGGIDDSYDGCQVVADANVVTVTLNYRLGMFGFLALPNLHDKAAGNTTGNWGLLDQRLALQWVHDNIAAFGGDPLSVMIHGQSAGSTSVYAHTLMPASRGLFSRAIMHSGVFDIATMFLKDAYALGSTFLDQVGCNATASRAANFSSPTTCLRAANYTDVMAAQYYLIFVLGRYPSATVDGSPVAFPKHPYLLMQEGAMARVPVVIGSNDAEGSIFALLYTMEHQIEPPQSMNQTQFQDAVGGWAMIPNSFADRVWAQYKPTTFGGYYAAAQAALADVLFWCPMHRVASSFARYTPTYGYYFRMLKPNSGCGLASTLEIFDVPSVFLNSLGAYHTYDIPFDFQLAYATRATPPARYNCTASAPYTCAFNDNEAQMAAFVSGAWSNFAARGSPLPPRTHRLTAPQLLNVTSWPRWTPAAALALELQFDKPKMIDFNSTVAARCQLWDEMMAYAIQVGTHYPDSYPPSPPPPSPKRPPPPKSKSPPPKPRKAHRLRA